MIFQELFGTPETVAAVPYSASPPNTYTPPLEIQHPFLEQLHTFASSVGSELSTEKSANCILTPSGSSTTITTSDCNSNRTGFLASLASPCPNKRASISRRRTGLTSQYFKTVKLSHKALSVRRKLDFRSTKTVHRRPILKGDKMGIAPEYSPIHRWTNEEREYVFQI
jgi:hypothetical protein